MNRKNQPTLNLSNPSPYLLKDAENGFVFTTDFGIVYKLTITDDSDYLSESFFVGTLVSLSVTPIAGEITQKDPRVEQTVIQAVLLIFEALPDAVFNYVCSLDNDQEAVRNRLFQRWYHKVGRDRFKKLDYINQDDRIYSSIIFRRNHPAENDIMRLFGEVFNK